MNPPEIASLRVGQTLERRLPGLGSAGYQWFATVDCENVVRVTLCLAADANEKQPESGSADTIATVVGVAPGSANVELIQRRAFETTPLRTIAIRVSVAPRP
jgi:predicted secreted protein